MDTTSTPAVPQGGAPADATYASPVPGEFRPQNPYVRGAVNAVTGAMQELGKRTSATTAAVVAPYMEGKGPAILGTPTPYEAGQYVTGIGKALAFGEAPYGLPPEGSMAEEYRRKGFTKSPITPAQAAILDARYPGASTVARALSGPAAAGFVTEMAVGVPVLNEIGGGAIAPAARMIGRAAEPLRQLPGIQQVGRALSPAFDVPAYRGAGKAIPYILGQVPSEREIVRSALRKAAGEGAVQAAQREDQLAVYLAGRKAAQKQRRLSGPEADDLLRAAVNEYERQGAAALQGLAPEEQAAVMAARQIAIDERATRAGVGLRPNELGSHIEKRAQIAETRIGQMRQLASQQGVPVQALEKARTKATRSLAQFEQKSGIGLPREIQSRRMDIAAAEAMLADRASYPIGYDPRILTPLGREAEGVGKYGTPQGLSTSLGGRRTSFYHEPTSEVEARLLSKARQKGTIPGLSGFGASVEEPPRYFQPMLKALEQHGENADKALSHAAFIQDMAGRFSVPAGKGTKPLSDLKVLTGFDKNARAVLEKIHVPEPQYRFMEQIARAYEPRNYGAIENAARQSLSAWKPLVTLVRPEFWVRNWAWSKFIQGAYGNVNPQNDVLGLSLVLRRDPSGIVKDMPQVGAVTQKALRKEFIRNQIIGGSRAVDIGERGVVGGFLGPTYQKGEDALRASYGIHLLRKGATMEEAAQGVKQLMFNYGPEAFTPGIQSARQRFVPFLAWTVNIPKLTGRTLGERPGALGMLGALAGDVNQGVGLSPEDQASMGKTFAERGGFATAQPDETGNVAGLTFSPVGFFDVNQWGPRPYHEGPLGPLQGPFDAAVTMGHPAASTLGSLITGRNYLGGYQYQEGVPVKLPSWTSVLAGRVPGIQVAPTSGQPYGPPQLLAALQLAGPVPNIPFDAMDPRWQPQMSALKALTGIPFTRTNPEQNRRYERKSEKYQRQDEKAARKSTRRFIRNLESEAAP